MCIVVGIVQLVTRLVVIDGIVAGGVVAIGAMVRVLKVLRMAATDGIQIVRGGAEESVFGVQLEVGKLDEHIEGV